MIAKIFSTSQIGLQSQLIECELDLTPALPSVIIVGLPDKAVQESKERIRSAIKQAGFEFPLGKLTVNLAPADVAKSGSGFDLPIAVGILSLIGGIKKPNSVEKTETNEKTLFAGELALDGTLRGINGALSMCLWAKNNGFKEIFLPEANLKEAEMVSGLKIFAITNLKQLVDHLNGVKLVQPVQPINLKSYLENLETNIGELTSNDLAYVRGQSMAKRALEIAASGGHNLLLVGQPGSGKTLLARSYPTILPRMTEEEVLEVTQIYSVAGLLKQAEIIVQRPFRSPHHSSSHVALVGGGSKIKPGEISLAHRGVLFLDEFPEFSRETLEALRQPLEDGFVSISRASGTIAYPSRFYLLAAANPTPSGFKTGDPMGQMGGGNQAAVNRYKAKFSGPILDRIDLFVEVNRPEKDELQNPQLAETSAQVAARVQKARDIQQARFKDSGIFTNSEMNLPMLEKYCQLGAPEKKLLDSAIDKFKLSARSYMRILKVSRTLADLDGSQKLEIKHLAEALQFRGSDFLN